MKFNAHGPEGLIDCRPPGQPSRLNGAHRAAPRRDTRGAARSRPCMASCAGGSSTSAIGYLEEFRVVVAKQTLSRELRAMGYRKLSARPRHHEQAEGAIENFKKAFPRAWTRSGARRASSSAAIEVWFADEARIGQKEQDHPALGQARHASKRADGLTNRLGLYLRRDLPQARKGCRALIMPRCNTEAMNLHLAEIAVQIAPGAHAALLVDQAGWHLSGPARHAAQHHLDPVAGEMSGAQSAGKRLAVPARQLALKTESFKSYDDVVDHCCEASGTTSSINPGGGCPSAFGIGPMGPDQRVPV